GGRGAGERRQQQRRRNGQSQNVRHICLQRSATTSHEPGTATKARKHEKPTVPFCFVFSCFRGRSFYVPSLYSNRSPGIRIDAMIPTARARALACLPLALAAMLFASSRHPPAAQTPQQPATSSGLPSETPASFEPVNDGFDYVKRVVMIPMRDGVKLHTVVIVPKGASRAPILLTRTPYDADALTSHANSSHLGPILQGYDNATDVIVEGGYIRAVQDVRGKHGSEGDYVMNRPLRGPQNPTI